MSRLHYSLLLPLFHLVMAILMICPQQRRIWPDLKNTAPADDPEAKQTQTELVWSPCYEYRPTAADHFVLGVEFPAGVLFGLDGSFRGCAQGLLSPVFRKLKTDAKTGTKILDILLALGVATQWWLIGWKIDSLYRANQSARLWLLPAAVISIAGLLMVPAGLGATGLLDLTAALATLAAFLMWISFLIATLAVWIKGVFKRSVSARTA